MCNVREGDYPGIVRFVGTTSFAKGAWCGVELRSAEGKNDGSVGGQRYFNCPKNYGLFVRPNQLTILDDEEDEADMPPPPPSTQQESRRTSRGAEQGDEDWTSMGLDLLHEHKKHIDAVLSQLREEMELLADFERMQDRLTKERVFALTPFVTLSLSVFVHTRCVFLFSLKVVTYNEAMRVCVEHRDDLSMEFKTAVQTCYDKYGISHDNLSLE